MFFKVSMGINPEDRGFGGVPTASLVPFVRGEGARSFGRATSDFKDWAGNEALFVGGVCIGGVADCGGASGSMLPSQAVTLPWAIFLRR